MKILRLALSALALLLLGACGGTAEDPSGVLHRGLSADPESLDPQKSRSVEAADVLRDIGEGLVAFTPGGELTQGSAERWDVSADGLEYTFHLRPGLSWSNGEPVRASHFVYGLRRLVAPETAAFYAEFVGAIVNAEGIVRGERPADTLGVEAPDDATLVIRLERPTPYLLSLLTHPSTFPIHPGAVAEHGDAFARAGNLLSNGAYVLESWEPGSLIRLVKNDAYWDAENTAIERVHYHVLAQEITQLNRYRAGELHITANVPPDSFEQVKKEYGSELHISPKLGVYYFGYNLTRPPFADNPELRQALSMAIDREVLVATVTGRGETAAYSWVPPGVDNYEPPRFSFADLTQDERNAIAKSLYAAAGFGAENPARIELRYNTSDTHRRIALAVQSMWQQVLGVETTLINEEFQVLLSNMRERKVTEVFRSSWIGDYNDAHSFLSIFETGAPFNIPGYSSEEFDRLMQSAAEQVDLDRRRLFLEEAERVMLADHPVIPLYFYVNKHLIKPEVQGWEDNVLDYHYSRHLSFDATP